MEILAADRLPNKRENSELIKFEMSDKNRKLYTTNH
jgi:hypothetical protein